MPLPLLAMGIGAGLGAFSSLLGPKKRTATQQYALDPNSQRYLDQYRQAAQQRYQQAGVPNQYLQQYGTQAGQLAQNLGFASQTGLGGIEGYFNPYEQQVVGGVQSDFDRQRGLAQGMAADQATRAGAFGGSREAVLRANALNDVNRNETGTLANLRYGGYQSAVDQLMGERGRMGNLGLAGFQGQFNLGGLMDEQQARALQQYQQGLNYGGSTSTSTTPLYRNPIAGALGGASLAYGMFGAGTPGAGAGGGGNFGFPSFGSSLNPRADYFGPQAGGPGFGGMFDPRANYLGPQRQPQQAGAWPAFGGGYGLGIGGN